MSSYFDGNGPRSALTPGYRPPTPKEVRDYMAAELAGKLKIKIISENRVGELSVGYEKDSYSQELVSAQRQGPGRWDVFVNWDLRARHEIFSGSDNDILLQIQTAIEAVK
jgi:hypothetical protein